MFCVLPYGVWGVRITIYRFYVPLLHVLTPSLHQPAAQYEHSHIVITYSKSEDEPGKVANPARGQLNTENDFFPIPVRAREFGLARRVRQSRPASACSSPYAG